MEENTICGVAASAATDLSLPPLLEAAAFFSSTGSCSGVFDEVGSSFLFCC